MVAGIVTRIMTSPGQTYVFSIFIEHFIDDLGVSRSLVSTLYTIGTLAGGFSMGFVGQQLDRIGPRRMAVLVSGLLGLGCLCMSLVRGAITLGLGFVLLRMLGQGSLGLVAGNMINRWWVRRRGMVNGVAGVATSLLGVGGFPNLANTLIAAYGWRRTYALLGIGVWVVMIPLGWLLVRDAPEDYGLSPDGILVDAEDADEGEEPLEEHWRREEAVRTRAFWIVALALASCSMLGTGLAFHTVSIFEDCNMSAATAAATFVPVAASAAAMRLLGGCLIDRIPARWLLIGSLIGQSTALVMTPFLTGRAMGYAYGMVRGLTSGLMASVAGVIWPMYFGRRHLGAISGVASMILIIASALGPMPMGIARDLLGSYRLVLTVAGIIPLTLAGLAVTLRPPERETERQPAAG